MQRVITFNSIFGAISAALYIITKIVAVEIAILWLLIAYLQLDRTAAIVAGVVISIPCLWACVKVGRLAYDAETDPVNNAD